MLFYFKFLRFLKGELYCFIVNAINPAKAIATTDNSDLKILYEINDLTKNKLNGQVKIPTFQKDTLTYIIHT